MAMRLFHIAVLIPGVLSVPRSPGDGELVETMILDPFGGTDTAFGVSLDLEGGRLAAGSPPNAIHVFDGSGSVDVTEQGSGHFGVRLALSDEFLVTDLSADVQRIYRRRGDLWIVDQELHHPGTTGGYDLDETTLAVRVATISGQVVVVLDRNDVEWAVTDVLEPAPATLENFGFAVELDADWMVVGAPEASPDGRGAAYVYRRMAGRWVLLQRLQPEGLSKGAFFGGAADIRGELLVVAANEDKLGGSAFVYGYEESSASWMLEDRLLPRPGQKNEEFAADVAIRGESVYVGAPNTMVRAFENAGRVYEYTALVGHHSPWRLSRRLIASNFFEATNFGRTVAASEDLLVVSATFQNPLNPNEFKGLVFMYSSF